MKDIPKPKSKPNTRNQTGSGTPRKSLFKANIEVICAYIEATFMKFDM